MPNDQARSYVVGTNGAAFVPSANLPVRFYTTGGASPVGQVVRCTGGQDRLAIGIAKRGVKTTGFTLSVLENDGASFQGQVNTTVKQGDKLAIANGSGFKAAPGTAGSAYVARVVKARTNAGLTWMEWVNPAGSV